MHTVKTIKEVDDNVWADFKSLAAKSKMKNGKFFEMLVEGYKKRRDDVWDEILNPGKILSGNEAKDIEETVKKLRAERGFMDGP